MNDGIHRPGDPDGQLVSKGNMNSLVVLDAYFRTQSYYGMRLLELETDMSKPSIDNTPIIMLMSVREVLVIMDALGNDTARNRALKKHLGVHVEGAQDMIEQSEHLDA